MTFRCSTLLTVVCLGPEILVPVKADAADAETSHRQSAGGRTADCTPEKKKGIARMSG
jgi:hypothetical protein